MKQQDVVFAAQASDDGLLSLAIQVINTKTDVRINLGPGGGDNVDLRKVTLFNNNDYQKDRPRYFALAEFSAESYNNVAVGFRYNIAGDYYVLAGNIAIGNSIGTVFEAISKDYALKRGHAGNNEWL